MINQVIRLVAPKQFESISVEENIEKNQIVVRPTFMSLCNADQRYYTGSRSAQVLKKKLPMALVHEGIGRVLYDPQRKFKVNQRVVMIPNTPESINSYNNENIETNYQLDSKFRSSGYDGFTQELVVLRRDCVLPLFDEIDNTVASFTEMLSVAVHSVRHNFELNKDLKTVGIWGDGNLAYLVASLIKSQYPKIKLIVVGKHPEKLAYFNFSDSTYLLDEPLTNISLDSAFECAGGSGSESAVNEIIDYIRPQGIVSLLGVSETYPKINTRMVLQKGLLFIGSSRSNRNDFKTTLELLKDNVVLRNQMNPLVGVVEEVDSIAKLNAFFDGDLGSAWGKSIMKWRM